MGSKTTTESDHSVNVEIARETVRHKAALALKAATRLRRQLEVIGKKGEDVFSPAQREYVLGELKRLLGNSSDLVRGTASKVSEDAVPKYGVDSAE